MISSKGAVWAQVDEQGRLVLPPEMAARFGLVPGSRLRLEEGANAVRLHRPVTHLTKIYVEPTALCNIACRTCIRNVWDEEMGRMSAATFERILEGVRQISPRPTVFFGGLGEPMYHRDIAGMVAKAKAAGARVEMISNGTMLTEKRARSLIDAGLDLLWISIDGATPESYSDIRLGAELPKVLKNLERFRLMRPAGHNPKPEIGIAFVAMKRNINELPKVLVMARHFGAMHFRVSNVLAYTEELRKEILYEQALNSLTHVSSRWVPQLSLPKMSFNEMTQDALVAAFRSGFNIVFAGNNMSTSNDVCNFIESGSISISWDGNVAPCLPLLHNHVHFIKGRQRHSKRHLIGNINERDLLDLWSDPDYIAYRERVHGFGFPPCTYCGGCDMLDANEEDCFGNEFPACGGCLWAQGLIQCP
jgi:MoaA/NifB/PqqE/SkfB family radical SAM enzyme